MQVDEYTELKKLNTRLKRILKKSIPEELKQRIESSIEYNTELVAHKPPKEFFLGDVSFSETVTETVPE